MAGPECDPRGARRSPAPAATPAYDESFETRFEREPRDDTTTFSPSDSFQDPNGRSGSGRLLDEFLVEDPADEEPARQTSSKEGQNDEENMSVWRPGRWIGN